MSDSNKLKDFYSANSQEVIENALKNHFQTLVNFTSNDSFIKIKSDIISSTIEPQILDKAGNIINEKELLLSSMSSLILGNAGVGKTVLIKRLIARIIESKNNFGFDILLLLRGREISNNSIIQSIKNTLNIHNEIDENELINTLSKNKTIIFIDGIDEVYSSEIKSILNQIESIIFRQNSIKVVLTSRLATVSRMVKGMNTFQLQTPSQERVLDFIKSFNLGSRFISELSQSGYKELTSSPLILSQLVRIFEVNGALPYNRKALYHHIIHLYLEEWDVMRNIRRVSKFESFHNERKFEFLTVLAYKSTIEESIFIFKKQKLIKIIESFIQDFDLRKSDVLDIVVFLIESTGLLIQTGFNTFSFIHRSIQEYLAANYLIRLPFLPLDRFNDNPEVYAIATALSSEPKLFEDYIKKNTKSKSKEAFKLYEIRLKDEMK